MSRNILKLVVTLIIGSSLLQAQSQNDKDNLTRLFGESKTLVINLKSETPRLREDFFLLDKTEDAINTLERISVGKDFSAQYLSSIKANEFGLRNYVTNKDVKLLRRVSSDYSTKASFAETNSDDAFKDILVIASTKNSLGMEVGNFRVWFAPTGKVKEQNVFSQLSSPTSRGSFVAGDYYFWAVNEKVETEWVSFNIGPNAKDGPKGKVENIDILVPLK